MNNESFWARGQAWGLYGYTVCFRETGDAKYLEALTYKFLHTLQPRAG
ncbi:MAG: hypothetical protein Q8N05_04210 [Bacteroidota bacterium]|nr:hypothetical protein [Bacteroidota bacterium]